MKLKPCEGGRGLPSRRTYKSKWSSEVGQAGYPGEYQQHVEQLFPGLDVISSSSLHIAERPKKAPDQYVHIYLCIPFQLLLVYIHALMLVQYSLACQARVPLYKMTQTSGNITSCPSSLENLEILFTAKVKLFFLSKSASVSKNWPHHDAVLDLFITIKVICLPLTLVTWTIKLHQLFNLFLIGLIL